MEITLAMAWALIIVVVSVVMNNLLSRSLSKKDDLVSEKTLKLILAPVEIKLENMHVTLKNVLRQTQNNEERTLNLERRTDNAVSESRIQRS